MKYEKGPQKSWDFEKNWKLQKKLQKNDFQILEYWKILKEDWKTKLEKLE